MGLQDDLLELKDANLSPGRKCRVGFLYETLPADELTVFRDLVEDKVVPATTLSEVMRRNGYDVAYGSIQRHRKRKAGSGCLCP
jgi:hypothetical protein